MESYLQHVLLTQHAILGDRALLCPHLLSMMVRLPGPPPGAGLCLGSLSLAAAVSCLSKLGCCMSEILKPARCLCKAASRLAAGPVGACIMEAPAMKPADCLKVFQVPTRDRSMPRARERLLSWPVNRNAWVFPFLGSHVCLACPRCWMPPATAVLLPSPELDLSRRAPSRVPLLRRSDDGSEVSGTSASYRNL